MGFVMEMNGQSRRLRIDGDEVCPEPDSDSAPGRGFRGIVLKADAGRLINEDLD
jgi:hypothetical protein